MGPGAVIGLHDHLLVVVAILVAIASSYTSLDLARRSHCSTIGARKVWVGGASLALGAGIWSMHFIAMLAFHIPGMQMGYDIGLTTLSLLLAISFTGLGFSVTARTNMTAKWTILGGIFMGLGIVAMHYVGMAAMQMPVEISYNWRWVGISVIVAIFAAIAALRLASSEQTLPKQWLAAGIMGIAIAGMHFAGMRAAVFHITKPHSEMGGLVLEEQQYLAAAVAGLMGIILALALASAKLDAVFQALARREARIALRLEVADVLRDHREKSALDEVAALMGQHFRVNRAGYGLLDRAQEEFDYQVCWTDGSVPPLLGRYPAKAFGEKIVRMLKQGKTVVIEDLFDAQLSNEELTKTTAREVDTRAILVVPFVSEGKLLSIVYLNDKRARVWHADDIAFMEELAERTRLVIERDEATRQLQRLNLELEERVEERTAQLGEAQQELLQHQKMEAVGQLAAGLAHDVNNILGAVMGSFELISRRASTPDKVKSLAAVGIEAVERGSRLTGQLLAFSRLEAIHIRPVIVCDIISGLAELITRTLGATIELRLSLNPHPIPVLGDPTQLEMMILNLAINARDAMPQGGTLTIGTSIRSVNSDVELADGTYVEIAVTDSGHGMDAETLRRATEPFFTTKPVGKGTGLGLAQIYASARKAGGTVRLASEPGIGTTVRVLLQVAERAASTSEVKYGIDGLPSVARRIVIADDDDACRQNLQQMLEEDGHTVDAFSRGGELLKFLEHNEINSVILDYAMPEMNGAMIAKIIRSRWPDVMIIFATGYSDLQEVVGAIGDNATILRKPYNFKELRHALRSVIVPEKSENR